MFGPWSVSTLSSVVGSCYCVLQCVGEILVGDVNFQASRRCPVTRRRTYARMSCVCGLNALRKLEFRLSEIGKDGGVDEGLGISRRGTERHPRKVSVPDSQMHLSCWCLNCPDMKNRVRGRKLLYPRPDEEKLGNGVGRSPGTANAHGTRPILGHFGRQFLVGMKLPEGGLGSLVYSQ
jgi:hypothetical protein